MQTGSLPALNPNCSKEQTSDLLLGIFNIVVSKDIRTHIGIGDQAWFENVVKSVMSIIGINTSYNSIAENVRTSPVPVRRYVVALEDVFLLYRVDRYDIHGKRFLKTREKYYVSDTGIRNTALRLTAENDLGRQLENVVFLKILRRACVLNTEWYRDDEIAFTAEGWGTWWSTTR